MKHKHTGRRSRRELLGMGAVLGGSLLAGRHVLTAETEARKLGVPLGPYSERSPFEKAVRWRRESLMRVRSSMRSSRLPKSFKQ